MAYGGNSGNGGASGRRSKRPDYASRMRERKQKKLYSEDWALGDDEIEGRRSFNLQEKLENPLFATFNIVKEMHGNELTVAYFQKYGFNTPLLFKEKSGLGLRVPTSNFTINDVRMCVGSRRVLDVMDVNTQKNSEMSMKDWQKYYEDPNKDKLLNVISLEFSHTKLENYVQSPTVVRQVDWVDCVWPKHLKDSQTEATNLLEDMKYPKVQKYCLMSVKGCYTDFHVDFGGTSVWYHIIKGRKVFWLIPPTEHNLALYERWVLSGKQSDIFFGDTVEKCARIILTEGNTFFIPTGWIHAVYTQIDSLVFGGNFLHSYGIDKQLKIAHVEDTTKVPQKFRYPFFTEMLWYVLERYVHCLLGHSHLTSGHDVVIPSDRPHVHLTQAELHGLKEIVMFLHMLPANKKNVPDLIKDPVALIQDVRTLIGLHRQDNRELAITGRPVLFLPDDGKHYLHSTSTRGPYITKNHHHQHHNNNNGSSNKHHSHQQQQQMVGSLKTTPPYKGKATTPPATTNITGNVGDKSGAGIAGGGGAGGGVMASGDKGGPRRRRTRCKKCEACQRSDCGECSFCLDMVKFGGPGRAKQTCNMRQCLQPMLPVTAACVHCGLDGWNQTPVTPLQKGPQRCESASNLMECSVCYEIAHPHCVQRLCPDFTGYINEDMPNSWECPMCCKLGKNTDYRPRHFRARQKSSDMRRMSISSSDTSIALDPTHPQHHQLQQFKHQQQQQQQQQHQQHDTQNYSDSDNDNKDNNSKDLLPIKKRRSSDGSGGDVAVVTLSANSNNGPSGGGETNNKQHNNSNNYDLQLANQTPQPRKLAFRMQLAQQIANNSTKLLKKPMVVVRPATMAALASVGGATTNTSSLSTTTLSGGVTNSNGGSSGSNNNSNSNNNNNNNNTNLALDKRCMLLILRYLQPKELLNCSLVCKTWAMYSIDPKLWRRMTFIRRHISSDILKGIVRRQPEILHLDWCHINKFQLPWLFQRLSQLKVLSLISCNVKTVITLRTNHSAILQLLDLSFISDFNDATLREILGPNNDITRRCISDEKIRFRNLNCLKLNGTDITDISMRYIVQYLPNIKELSLSLCPRISDAGIAQLTTKPASTINTLIHLDLSHTKLITEISLDYLTKCKNLIRLDCRHSLQISTQALIKFAAKSDRNLQVKDIKLVVRRGSS